MNVKNIKNPFTYLHSWQPRWDPSTCMHSCPNKASVTCDLWLLIFTSDGHRASYEGTWVCMTHHIHLIAMVYRSMSSFGRYPYLLHWAQIQQEQQSPLQYSLLGMHMPTWCTVSQWSALPFNARNQSVENPSGAFSLVNASNNDDY